ncbi:MAG: hypothetical protein AAFN74_13940 [Myxococcota bacterium]
MQFGGLSQAPDSVVHTKPAGHDAEDAHAMPSRPIVAARLADCAAGAACGIASAAGFEAGAEAGAGEVGAGARSAVLAHAAALSKSKEILMVRVTAQD